MSQAVGSADREHRPVTKTITRSTRAAIILSLLTSGSQAVARDSCSRDWLCVDAKEGRDHVEIYVENLKPYPLTISLRASTRNLEPPGRQTITETVSGGDRKLILRMDQVDSSRDWHYRYWYDWTIGSLDVKHDDKHLYRFPYASGNSYYVLQGFGSRFSHTGLEEFAVDFHMPVGTPIHAARGGTVVQVVEEHLRGCWEDGCGKYANFIVILHSDGSTGEYYHLKNDGSYVQPGDHVTQGQLIGLSGNTGHTTMPHLHFAVYEAVAWGNTRSIPIRFNSAKGVVSRPRRGGRYIAD